MSRRPLPDPVDVPLTGSGSGRQGTTTGHPRSHAEVTAQQKLGLLDHGGVAVRVVAECESEQVVGYLDGDEAAGRQTRVGKAVASPEQIMEPGSDVAVVLSLGLFKLRTPLSMVE